MYVALSIQIMNNLPDKSTDKLYFFDPTNLEPSSLHAQQIGCRLFDSTENIFFIN